VNARSARFDRYGDHLVSRGVRAGICPHTVNPVRDARPSTELGSRISIPSVRRTGSGLPRGRENVAGIEPNGSDESAPAGWVVRNAAQYFDDQAARLLPAAARFIDHCLDTGAPEDGRRTHE
jgi:hypothetical protein